MLSLFYGLLGDTTAMKREYEQVAVVEKPADQSVGRAHMIIAFALLGYPERAAELLNQEIKAEQPNLIVALSSLNTQFGGGILERLPNYK